MASEKDLTLRSWSAGASVSIPGRVSFVIANVGGEFCFALMSDAEARQMARYLMAAARDVETRNRATAHGVEGDAK
jgi:hypothetical protein